MSGVLFLGYFGWGVYVLTQRFKQHVELNDTVKVITLAAVFIFLAFEYSLLKMWLGKQPLGFVLALMGLIVSAAALYGPMASSLLSHAIMEMVMPSGREEVHGPRYAPGEACELRGDYEGAVREYLAVARMFPKDARTAVRVADNLAKLGRVEEAAPWFERAMECCESPEETLTIANRLFLVYTRDLKCPQKARRVFETYLERFPDSEYAESVRQRIASLDASQQDVQESA